MPQRLIDRRTKEEVFAHLISHTIRSRPAGGTVAGSGGGYPRWWSLFLATGGFAVIPWFILGGGIDHQFSVSYSAKIMDIIKIRAENRCNSIDLFLNEPLARFSVWPIPKSWNNHP